jgi:hypothetical protein
MKLAKKIEKIKINLKIIINQKNHQPIKRATNSPKTPL